MLTLKLRRAAKREWPAEVKAQLSKLNALAETCSRQLRGWADSLQNSDIKGQRHLNDSVRRNDEQRKRATAFQEKLREMLPENHLARRPKPEA